MFVKQRGFTIVELLIVIVVIGILAAITIVAFNGVQKRASAAAVQSELSQNAKAIMATAATTGAYSNVDVMTASLKFDTSRNKVVSYCSNATNFALAVQTTSGDKYYKTMSGAVIQNNAMDAFLPCDTAGITGAETTYLNLPTACGAEGNTTSCTLSGPATVAYGSTAQGRFARVLNVTASPFTCSSALAGFDPAPGYIKSCYIYPN